MTDGLSYLPAAAALTIGWYELRPARRRSAAVRCLYGFWLCMGGAMALLAPETAAALHALPGLPALVHVLGRELEMAALFFLPMSVARLGLPHRRPVSERSHIIVSAAACCLCAGLFVIAVGGDEQDPADTGVVIASGTGWAAFAAFDAVFTLYSLWCLGLFVLPVHRCARGLRPGPLRAGLRLVTASTAVGAVWAAWGVSGIVNMATDHRQGAGMDIVAQSLAAGCLLLALLGATAAQWHPTAARLTGRLRAWRDYQALEPLWAALHAVAPGTTLAVPGLRTVPLALRGAEFALYRRVIEIRDGYLALRPYHHPQVASWTASALGRFPVRSVPAAAVVEAAAVAAALEAARHGRRRAAGHTSAVQGVQAVQPLQAVPVRATVDAEVAWLISVTEAFTGARAVEYTRCRARHLAE